MSEACIEPELEPARERPRPARPLVWLAAVSCAGSWCGAHAALDPRLARLLAMCTLAALLASAVCAPRILRLRRAARAQSAIALAMLFLCALLRADALRPGAGAAGSGADDAAPSAVPRSGIWRSRSVFGDRERGELAGDPQCLEVEPGTIADGECVAILSGSPSPVWSRGPVGGPHASDAPSERPVDVAPDEIVRLERAQSTWGGALSMRIARLREGLLDRSEKLADVHTRGLAAAFLLGDVSKLAPGTADRFARTGTYHVLAISGLQVALVAVLLVWPFAACCALLARTLSGGGVRLSPAWIRIGCLALFVPLAGGGAPVVRSALAFAVGSLASLLPAARPFVRMPARDESSHGLVSMARRADSLSLWSLALAFECIAHPLGVLTLSVQLSYAATLGLIVGTGPVLTRLRELCGGARIGAVGAMGRARSPAWRIPLQRSVDALLAACAGSIAAVLATLPWTWARFGEWSPIGMLATPALLVPMACLLTLGWLWLLAPSTTVETLLDLAAHSVMRLLEWCDSVPASPDPLPPRPWVCVALATLLAFAALCRDRRASEADRAPRAWLARFPVARAALVAWGALWLPWTAAPSRFELWALDVGSGTAVVFRAPELGTWVFDAGSRDRPGVGREALVPLLESWEVATVGIVLSHADADHDRDLDEVIERFPPHTFAGAIPAHLGERLAHSCRLVDVRRGEVELASPPARAAGIALYLGRELGGEDNEGSRFLRIVHGGRSLVLCGDAEAEGLSAWLAAQHAGRTQEPPLQSGVEMALLPHHGSETELLGPLLRVLAPREAWISCTGDAPVARELRRRGQTYRSTARDGPLFIALDAVSQGPAAP